MSKDLSFDDLMAPKNLGHMMSEVLRFNDPVPMGFPRTFPRDVEVDGIKFKKGDCWSIGMTGIHYTEKNSPDANSFN